MQWKLSLETFKILLLKFSVVQLLSPCLQVEYQEGGQPHDKCEYGQHEQVEGEILLFEVVGGEYLLAAGEAREPHLLTYDVLHPRPLVDQEGGERVPEPRQILQPGEPHGDTPTREYDLKLAH